MEVEIPLKPISVNKAFQGRRFKTKDYKVFEKQAYYFLPTVDKVKGWVDVWYEFGLIPTSFGISDTGNMEKCLTDVLVKKGYIDDDRKIINLHLKKVRAKKFYTKIKILPTNGE